MPFKGIVVACALVAAGLPAGAARAQLFAETNAILMTEAGAAGVGAGAPFGQRALAAVMPGLRVTPSQIPDGEGMRPVFLVSQAGEAVLRIHGGADGRVSMVEGLSRKVLGPGRTRIGMKFAQMEAGRVAYCAPGEGGWSGALFCAEAADATLWFVFRAVPDDAPIAGSGVSPEARAAAELAQIRWVVTPGMAE